MAAPGIPGSGRQPLVELGQGQPLLPGIIPDGTVLFRSAHLIKGSASGSVITSVWANSFFIQNQDDGLYYEIKCRNVDGVATLYLSDTGTA